MPSYTKSCTVILSTTTNVILARTNRVSTFSHTNLFVHVSHRPEWAIHNVGYLYSKVIPVDPSQKGNRAARAKRLPTTCHWCRISQRHEGQPSTKPSPFAMHLMYTLDEEGNRVYTLKVRLYSYRHFSWHSRLLQKVTDAGKTTKSAHPGASETPESSVFETYYHDICLSSILT